MTKTAPIERYFHDTLGVTVSLLPWEASRRLPLFLRDGYTYLQTEILGVPCLLMVDGGEGNPSPATIRKHRDQVQSKWEGEIIYVREQLAAYQRKRLIEQKVLFLVPGNQMYLPMLGIDLREHFRQLRQATLSLSPATQAMLLYALFRGKEEVYVPVELAERLGYSKMTMTRVFNELEAEDLGDISVEGRQRCLKFRGNRQELWQKALPLLRSPIKHHHHVERTGERFGLVAGLSALSRYSMLAAPGIPVVAVTAKAWRVIQEQVDLRAMAADDPEGLDVEIWSYDPHLFAEDDVVDRLSLFLSLKDSEDERVESALEEMMGVFPW